MKFLSDCYWHSSRLVISTGHQTEGKSGNPCLWWSFSLSPSSYQQKSTYILNCHCWQTTINHEWNQHQDEAHGLWWQDGHQTMTLGACLPLDFKVCVVRVWVPFGPLHQETAYRISFLILCSYRYMLSPI